MKTVAELAFEYIWLLLFAGEDVIDLDYSVKCKASLFEHFAAMSTEERAALSQVAESTRNRLLGPPDRDGYTLRTLVTEEKKQFLNAMISGELFDQWA